MSAASRAKGRQHFFSKSAPLFPYNNSKSPSSGGGDNTFLFSPCDLAESPPLFPLRGKHEEDQQRSGRNYFFTFFVACVILGKCCAAAAARVPPIKSSSAIFR